MDMFLFSLTFFSPTELPFITENPRDKVRKSGQSVAFCCQAESDPPPNKYEW